MEFKCLRKVASGLLLAALMCTLPAVAAAAPSVPEEGAATSWWQGLQQRVAEWVAAWVPSPPAAGAGLRLREPTPPRAEPPVPILRFVIAKDGANSQCTGEGGPEWDPDGCQ